MYLTAIPTAARLSTCVRSLDFKTQFIHDLTFDVFAQECVSAPVTSSWLSDCSQCTPQQAAWPSSNWDPSLCTLWPMAEGLCILVVALMAWQHHAPTSVAFSTPEQAFTNITGVNINLDMHRSCEGRVGLAHSPLSASACAGNGMYVACLPTLCFWGPFSVPVCDYLASPFLSYAGNHNNLFSNIVLGAGSRPFDSSGDAGRGAHAGEPSREQQPHRHWRQCGQDRYWVASRSGRGCLVC